MGWEARARGGRYYIRKQRIGNRVISTYIGGGLRADVLAAQAAEAAYFRDLLREQRAAERREQQELDQAVADVCSLIGDITAAAMLLNGYHQHKRQWRKRRDI
jgi:hypothetical protein